MHVGEPRREPDASVGDDGNRIPRNKQTSLSLTDFFPSRSLISFSLPSLRIKRSYPRRDLPPARKEIVMRKSGAKHRAFCASDMLFMKSAWMYVQVFGKPRAVLFSH